MALAFVCAASGYQCTLVSSDAFSEEKRTWRAALGAEVVLVPSVRKRITMGLIREMLGPRRLARLLADLAASIAVVRKR